MERIGTAFAVCATSLFVLATPALSRTSIESAAPAAVHDEQHRRHHHSQLVRAGQGDGQARRKDADLQGWHLRCRAGFRRETGPDRQRRQVHSSAGKPKFRYFGLTGKPHPGTYGKDEHVISFQLAGKAYAMQGGALWAVPWPKVTIAAGGKKGSFSGHAFLGGLGKGRPASGSWSC